MTWSVTYVSCLKHVETLTSSPTFTKVTKLHKNWVKNTVNTHKCNEIKKDFDELEGKVSG